MINNVKYFEERLLQLYLTLLIAVEVQNFYKSIESLGLNLIRSDRQLMKMSDIWMMGGCQRA